MKVGMIGLGKLGLPVAVAMAIRGADVVGYDIDESRMNRDPKPELEMGPENEGHYNEWLKDVFDSGNLKFSGFDDTVLDCDIVFVAVQTPHDPDYEGITPTPLIRKDFNYCHLAAVVADINELCDAADHDLIMVVISTCLPGTMRKVIKPLLCENISLVYNPYFIAMGTTMHDFLHPEAVLIGSDSYDAISKVSHFYRSIDVAPLRVMGMESAELAKVAYNTWISAKLMITNTLAEICHKTEADIDEVMQFLRVSDYRITSPRYMDAGMGDGGGCHPRDNIALSWLAQELGIHHDLFNGIMSEREEHARWLATMMIKQSNERKLPMVIMGYAYKPETNLTIGSHALLVREFIRMARMDAELHDTHVSEVTQGNPGPAVFLIGCKHPEYKDTTFPKGSVVIDPWRYIQEQNGVEVISIGRNK